MTDDHSEIEFWLKSVLSRENLDQFTFKLSGNSEKGDGYSGNIHFIHVDAVKNNNKKEYDLVLKCTKNASSSEIMDIYFNEIRVFESIIPAFSKFAAEKGLSDDISSVICPYFGKFVSDSQVVIGLQDLKKLGYDMHDRKQPLGRAYVDLIMKNYAKYHAICGAYRDQKKEEYDMLTADLIDMGVIFLRMAELLKDRIDEICTNLKGELDTEIINQYSNIKDHVQYIVKDMWNDHKFSVLVHGDSWNNNFMFQHHNSSLPSKLMILDWQLIYETSPIRDLSYFLMAGLSDQDFKDMDSILALYYDTFSDYLKRLGSDPEKLYPRSVFLEEWRKYAKFGVLTASLIVQACLKEKDDVKDIVEEFREGNMKGAFGLDFNKYPEYLERMKYIIENAARQGLLSV